MCVPKVFASGLGPNTLHLSFDHREGDTIGGSFCPPREVLDLAWFYESPTGARLGTSCGLGPQAPPPALCRDAVIAGLPHARR